MRNLLLLLITVITLVSCAKAEVVDDPKPTTTSLPVTTTALTQETTIPVFTAGLQDLIDHSRADLASTLGVQVSAIEVETAEEVTWSDGSIGCPQPGFMYTQALEEGVRIVLVHKGLEYAYHQGGIGEVFLCVTPGD